MRKQSHIKVHIVTDLHHTIFISWSCDATVNIKGQFLNSLRTYEHIHLIMESISCKQNFFFFTQIDEMQH